MTGEEGRPAFRIRRVLGRSVRIWARNIILFTILGVILYSPLVVLVTIMIASRGLGASPGPRAEAGLGAIFSLGACLLWVIAPLSVIDGVLRQLRGEAVRFGGCLRVYLTRLFPALGVGLLIAIAALSTMMAGSMVAGLFSAVGLPAPLAAILVLAATSSVYCIFWVAVPVAAVERAGILASLRRSQELTRGARGAIFLLLFVALTVQILPLYLARLGLGQRSGPAVVLAMLTFGVALGAYAAVSTTVAYHDLRLAKEGVGVRELARVFE